MVGYWTRAQVPDSLNHFIVFNYIKRAFDFVMNFFSSIIGINYSCMLDFAWEDKILWLVDEGRFKPYQDIILQGSMDVRDNVENN